MQSLSNVIKNTNIKSEGSKSINTDYSMDNDTRDDNIKKSVESYEILVKTMVENARKQSEAIVSRAYASAQEIEQEAYKQAYESGYQEGRQQGYNDAYEETIGAASKQAELLIENATNILMNAKQEYEKYMIEKQEQITELAVNIAETIVRKKLESVDGLNEIILETLDKSRNTNTFVIKVAPHHSAELRVRIDEWKERLAPKGEIFIIADEALEPGNAVIEKNNGRVLVGIDIGMESVRQALM
jgi:flagellar assembly protein FliH